VKTTVDDRLVALRTVRVVGDGLIPALLAAGVDELLTRAGERRDRSPDYTVVGIFGATGSGKSSLVNALVGAEVARTHVRRPTTSEALAVTWDPEGATELLDWLEVRERRVRDTAIDPRASKLILLDLPDFDSVETANRAIAVRLAAQVDALVWVVDPQKYADEVLHAQFIAPHARHGAVTLIVLNQTDLLSATEVKEVLASLKSIVERDGIAKARVLAVSARTGEGIDALRTAIGDLSAARLARETRLGADITTLAERILGPGTAQKIPSRATEALSEEVGVAAGIDVVSRAVASSYRKRSGQATGWPLVSWLLRLRADPLTRLGLGPKRRGDNPDLHRSSLPELSSGARARVSLAVRSYADAAAAGLAETWRTGIRSTAERGIAALPDQLDLAIARTALPAKGSWWWVIFTILQWVVLVAGLVGVGWLLAAALLPTIGMPRLEIPTIEGWAVPTLLIAAAVLGGILLGLLAAVLGTITAASRRRRSRKLLLAAVGDVVQQSVVAPIAADLDRAKQFASALAIAKAG